MSVEGLSGSREWATARGRRSGSDEEATRQLICRRGSSSTGIVVHGRTVCCAVGRANWSGATCMCGGLLNVLQWRLLMSSCLGPRLLAAPRRQFLCQTSIRRLFASPAWLASPAPGAVLPSRTGCVMSAKHVLVYHVPVSG